MPRQTRSETVFFRHEGKERKDIYLRINPSAIRWQQGRKGGVTETLGGYFREIMYSSDPQYNGLMLPDFTIEATTGVAFRKELKTIDWIWRHSGDRKADETPADTYFFDLIENGAHQGIERDAQRAYLIEISNFAWDDTTQNPYEIRFSMRCKILRDLFWDLDDEPPGNMNSLPSLETLTAEDQSQFGTVPELTGANFSFTNLTL